ncbi:MAG TPA: metallophosphoesterase [Nitrospiraceae bacterium]|nr:metallophosphoesterase [Nitrospiraceae bacterium]
MAKQLVSTSTDSLPQFDELYVVSDLHLGGPPDFQIFNSGFELKRLIDYLRTLSPDSKIALLINGDFVDFLAELPAMHFDPAGAITKLNRIATGDHAFARVFGALRTFVNTKNRRLVINLGNHDLELALPWVRARLLEILSGGSDAACGRITLAFDGVGVSCKVGDATILCVHGNEVDTWNVADYETIRKFSREVTHGRPIDSWIPNAGSQLVVEVMNDLKRKYPFIDLLKPETQAAVPTLFALAPDQSDKLRAIGSTVRRLAWDKIKRITGRLGSAEEDDGTGKTTAARELHQPSSSQFSGLDASDVDRQQYAQALLDDAEERLNRGVSPMTLVGSDELGRYLGMPAAVMKLIRGEDTCEVLREALENLHKDRSFDPQAEDATFKTLDEQIGDGFDFLITGHTHLARALPRKKRSGWYFNSGTWARLIKLEEKVLSDAKEFKKVFDVFEKGTMSALDAFPQLVIRKLNVVAIRSEGNKVHGELRQASLQPGGDILPKATNYRFTMG